MVLNSLAPSLLTAMPALADPNFHRAVILLVHHDNEGAFGMVLNRPTEISASALCEFLGFTWRGAPEQIVHWGGPVQTNTGWVICGENRLADSPEATRFSDTLHCAGSLDILRHLAEAPPPSLRLFLGYAGWGAGQLESELAQNAWVTVPLSPDAVFSIDHETLWNHAWQLLGVDPSTVVGTPGVH